MIRHLNMFRLLATLLSAAAAGFGAYADEFISDGIKYSITSAADKTVKVISHFDWDSFTAYYRGDMEIPAAVKYEGAEYSVTAIDSRAFQFCGNLESLVIPATVSSVGDYAFDRCGSLKRLQVNAAVPPECGSNVFIEGTTEALLVVPEGSVGAYRSAPEWSGFKFITSNADYTRYFESDYISYEIVSETDRTCRVTSCDNHLSGAVEIPETVHANGTAYSVTAIGDEALTNLTGNEYLHIPPVTELTIPASVKSIGENAFILTPIVRFTVLAVEPPVCDPSTFEYFYDTALLVVPEGKVGIYRDAPCWNRFNVITDRPDYVYEFEDGGVRFRITSETEKSCEVVNRGEGGYDGDVVIPEKAAANGAEYVVRSIDQFCFVNVPMRSIVIPSQVSFIEDVAFFKCYNLRRVEIKAAVPPECWYAAVEGISENADLIVPPGSTDAYAKDMSWGEFRFISDDPSASSYFDYNTLSYRVTSLQEGTCAVVAGENKRCGDLVIPASAVYGDCGYAVTSIAEEAFNESPGLTSVTIPHSMESIGRMAFANCALKSVSCVAEVPPVCGDFAFEGSYTTARLSVPSGCADAYASAAEWQLFCSTDELNGIVAPETDGATPPTQIYRLDGTIVRRSLDELSPGIYIVRRGPDIRKVIVD